MIRANQSFVASYPEVVKDASYVLTRRLLQLSYRVHSHFLHIKVVSRPGLQVTYVLLSSHLHHNISLLSVHFIEYLWKGVPSFICIVTMQLVHIKGKVRQHLIVELVEVVVFLRVLSMDFSKHISKDHKHSPIIQHAFDFSETSLASEEVESLPNCD